jgi:hypothetical protein
MVCHGWGLGALLVALRKVHGRRDEESGYASPLIVIEARSIAKAHATLWTKYARRVGARLGAVKETTIAKKKKHAHAHAHVVTCCACACVVRCMVRGEVVAKPAWRRKRRSLRACGVETVRVGAVQAKR